MRGDGKRGEVMRGKEMKEDEKRGRREDRRWEMRGEGRSG